MDIVYNSDDNYAVHTAVSITSIFENNRLEESIRIFVLGNNISEDSGKKLRSIGDIYAVTDKMSIEQSFGEVPKGFRREVRVIDISGFDDMLLEVFGSEMNAGRFTSTALARIFATEYLPADVEKYLYLDCDTVVMRRLNMLFQTRLEEAPAGLVPEPTIYPEVREYLGIAEDKPYFNTGVMLVDRRRWDELDVTGRAVEFYRSRNGRLPFSDQDIINYVLKGNVKVLWQGYDFFSNYHYRSYKSLCAFAPWYGKCMSEKEYEAASSLPAIIHFAGAERPWIKGSFNPYRAEYEKYLGLSPWNGTEKTDGQQREMLLYHLMNLITKTFPSVRDRISHYYYKKTVSENT